MEAKIKKTWIRALRSGDYKQAREQLRTDKGYCCLGVLCDLYQQQHPDSSWKPYFAGGWTFIGKLGALPRQVARWSGLHSPEIVIGNARAFPDAHNDGGHSFETIADAIEEQL